MMFHLLMQPIRISELKKVNPIRACEYFNDCFKDPSTFTVVIVGKFDPTISIPLVLQYLVRVLHFILHQLVALSKLLLFFKILLLYAGWSIKAFWANSKIQP